MSDWSLRQLGLFMALALAPSACEGPAGVAGPRGNTGEAGPQGDEGSRGEQGDPGERGEMGADGPPALSSEPKLEAEGLVGLVRDPSQQLVVSGSVVLVPASAVAELAKQSIDLGQSPAAAQDDTHDEPLEDLLDQNAQSYPQAPVDELGTYRFTSIPDGAHFVVWKPADDDSAHLPGGSACRSARERASLVGTRLDLRVSGRPSDMATYTGSTPCLGCHGRHRSLRSAHRVGLQVTGVRGALQDVSPWPMWDAGLTAFEQATTLYYYDCDLNRDADAPCRVSTTEPTGGAGVRFELHLARDATRKRGELGAYTAEFVNRSGGASKTYPVVLTYGGALHRQQYLAQRVDGQGRVSYFVLPLQFNATGSLAYPQSTDWPYRDYRSGQWYDFSGSTLAEPSAEQSFDSQCAGCHLTGMRLTGDASSGWRAHAVADPNGDFDIDGDGRLDEINVGCESCHGPGSEHIEARTRGLHIVSPSLITPERELMLCGSCHSRPVGKAAGGTEAPLSAAGRMPGPGLRRSDYLRDFTARIDATSGDLFASGDSRFNHQQYTDFIRSGMYRNESVLMTCSSCHDAHGSDETEHMLRKAADDNSACTSCHSGSEYTAPRGHVERATHFIHDGVEEVFFVCTTCHMVRTASGGARHPELLDKLPSTANPVQYFHGDLSSHRFAVTARNQAAAQPVAATLTCGFCHASSLANP